VGDISIDRTPLLPWILARIRAAAEHRLDPPLDRLRGDFAKLLKSILMSLERCLLVFVPRSIFRLPVH